MVIIMLFNDIPQFQTSAYPTKVTLSISNICQQICRFCYYNHNESRKNKLFIPLDIIQRMTWLEHVPNIILCGAGELLVHPQYPEIIETIRKISPNASITAYTNGLGLTGRRLTATLRYANIVHISQNAVNETTYNKIIKNGSYTKAMQNLETLAKLRSLNVEINLSMVVMRETINEIKDVIDLMHNYAFNNLILMSYKESFIHYSYSMPQTSLCNIYEEIDTDEILNYGKSKNIPIIIASHLTSGMNICMFPFNNVLIHIESDGTIHLKYCCNGTVHMTISEEALADIKKVWYNDRIELIRKTVNNRFRLVENKMCLSCRLVNLYWDKKRRYNAIHSIGIKYMNDLPQFFDSIHIP